MVLWFQWYLEFIFELFIKQIFLLPHSFFRKLFTCAAFAFNLSRRGTIPDIKILLLSNLQDAINSKIFYPISTALVFCLKPLVPQRRTIHCGSFDIVGCMYDFMSSVVATLNCFITTSLFSSNSHPFMILILCDWCVFQLHPSRILKFDVGWTSRENLLKNIALTFFSELNAQFLPNRLKFGAQVSYLVKHWKRNWDAFS